MESIIAIVLPIVLALIAGYQKYQRQRGERASAIATAAVDILEYCIDLGGDKSTKQFVAGMPPGDAKSLIEERLDRANIREMLRAKRRERKT